MKKNCLMTSFVIGLILTFFVFFITYVDNCSPIDFIGSVPFKYSCFGWPIKVYPSVKPQIEWFFHVFLNLFFYVLLIYIVIKLLSRKLK